MKANEAPEKLYFGTQGDKGLLDIYSEKEPDDDIEYIRTDVFIEKALKWYCRDCECNDNCTANHKCAFRDYFEMYLKGNENALSPKIENALDPEGFTTENYRCRHLISKLQNDFIEKACEYLNKNCRSFILTEKDIEDFKNYMKGE